MTGKIVGELPMKTVWNKIHDWKKFFNDIKPGQILMEDELKLVTVRAARKRLVERGEIPDEFIVKSREVDGKVRVYVIRAQGEGR